MLTQSNLAEQSFEFSPVQAVPMAPGYGKSSQTAYKQTAVETATPEKLVVMLYNGALRFLHKGEKGLLAGNYEEANEALSRALDIVVELNATLNMEAGDIASNLRDLYNFYAREILAANIKRDAAYLKPVIDFFAEFTQVWSSVS
ncbi:MAG: flagellar export chaperone FliS [Gracilibacteraceae bacterium]|jgi:flagellar protein FliS|nr:flagellar export chaperone FliS [Gracilibacteraceae bacterium]